MPGALTDAIVESERVRVERTRYGVPGWGVGELWTARDVILAHEFDFAAGPSGEDPVVHLATRAAFLDARPDPAATEAESELAEDVIARVRGFLDGADRGLADVPLDLEWCTDFQQCVISALRKVRRGEAVTYGELAALVGRPGAQRAVGSICATNRFAFFVPCHRVVSAAGIGGYGAAGVDVKRRLLALEGVSL